MRNIHLHLYPYPYLDCNKFYYCCPCAILNSSCEYVFYLSLNLKVLKVPHINTNYMRQMQMQFEFIFCLQRERYRKLITPGEKPYIRYIS